MLSLSRRVGESIIIRDTKKRVGDIVITIGKKQRRDISKEVVINIDAPMEIDIIRDELKSIWREKK